jgi:hypothetical protein
MLRHLGYILGVYIHKAWRSTTIATFLATKLPKNFFSLQRIDHLAPLQKDKPLPLAEKILHLKRKKPLGWGSKHGRK